MKKYKSYKILRCFLGSDIKGICRLLLSTVFLNYLTFNLLAQQSFLPSDTLDVEVIRYTDLQGVEITEKSNRYSKKDNPAYELMRKIRDSKSLGDPRMLPEYSEDFYNKIVIGLNNNDASDFHNKGKYRFMKEYVDTSAHTHLPVLLLSLHETAGTRFHSLNFLKDKVLIKAERNGGIDDAFDSKNINTILTDILNNVNIYEDDIKILHQRFVSPISHLADNFYRYYLNDTVIIDNKPHIELNFSPRSPEMFGFNGRMYVEADDSTYFIRKVEMRVPRVINLNYVDNVYITQEYYKDKFGKRHLKSDDMSLELTLMPGTDTFYARRLTNLDEPVFSTDHSLHNFLYNANNYIVYENSNLDPWDKWDELRLTPLSRAEGGMGSMMSRLRKYPIIYWSEKILKILVDGYVATSKKSKVDLGPINTLLSYNSLEGIRMRIGGLTTGNLSNHWFGRGYIAYGTRDRKFKYNAELEYSLAAKKYHSKEFPVNSILLHYNYELDNIGRHYEFTNPDNVFLSLQRESCRLSLYRREAAATYQLELSNHFSFVGSFRHRIYYGTKYMPLIDGYGHMDSRYTLAGFLLELRFAPGEKFLQSRGRRYAVNRDAPIIRLTQEFVPKGMLGSRFTLNKTELSVSKRIWFSAFGYLDAILKGGKLWSQVDYPALIWPDANLSFTIQPESYSLLNPMEFPLDYYGSLDLSYFANGLIFNQIPLIKKLKLREVFTFKALMGGLTQKNNPEYNDNLYRFPSGAATGHLASTPYMEASVGIDNILTCLRVDYVWRLTYRHEPNISRGGVRLSLHFSF